MILTFINISFGIWTLRLCELEIVNLQKLLFIKNIYIFWRVLSVANKHVIIL